jgi:bacteriocin-like protein
MKTITITQLSNVTGGASLTAVKNAAKGFVGGLACLGKFTVDGTPGTNSYDTYLACQRKAHQF